MTWDDIRRHFAVLLAHAAEKGVTQQIVAARGGLQAKNAISKMLRNRARGPTVETFVKAVAGLGLSVSDFFADVERNAHAVVSSESTPAATTPTEQVRLALIATTFELLEQRLALRSLENRLGELTDALDRVPETSPPSPTRLRARVAHRRKTRKTR